MNWRFLVDANLPVALARAMEGIGYPSAHVSDLGSVSYPDAELWQVAAARGDVIVSKDFDFVLLAKEPNGSQRVVWLRMGNTRKQVLLARMTAAMPEIIAALDAGELVVEVR